MSGGHTGSTYCDSAVFDSEISLKIINDDFQHVPHLDIIHAHIDIGLAGKLRMHLHNPSLGTVLLRESVEVGLYAVCKLLYRRREE